MLKDGLLEVDLGWDRGRRKRARYDGKDLDFLLEVAGVPTWTEGGSTIATRAGTVTVVRVQEDPPRDAVKLGETILFEGDFVTLYGKYPLGGQDVVLVGDNCGGTACATDKLSLLVLEPGKKARIFSDEGFISLGPSLDGKNEVPLKTAVWSSTSVSMGAS